MVPMILAVFANDPFGSLGLVDERKALSGIFNSPTKFELKVLENADSNYIFETIEKENLWERIVIFHFGGHSNGKNILLLDGKASSLGLARLFKRLTNLQLIFLNGCDNYDQTLTIQREGTTAAIVTTVAPLNARLAIDFANFFYYAFYRFNTLNDSFESAETRVILNYGLAGKSFNKLERGIAQEELDLIKKLEAEPKTIYALSSLVPLYLKRNLLFKIQYELNPVDINYKPNKFLISGIAENIVNNTFNERRSDSGEFEVLKKSFDLYKKIDNNRNFGDLVANILALLPYPIGFHINLLVAQPMNSLNEDEMKIRLLKRQIVTYNSLIQLLSFTFLSCFWSEIEKNSELDISASQWEVLKNFISSNELNNQDINYPSILITIREVFENNNQRKKLDPFITEYQNIKDIFDDEESFYKAHLHMQGLKSSIYNDEISKMDVNWLCFETENLLHSIFSKSGFIAKYKLTTVKNIEISKSRLKKPAYFIKRIILDRSVVDDDDIEIYPDFTDSYSVLLTKGLDQNTFFKFLSLSPFIIDENSLKSVGRSKLYFFSHNEDDKYIYRWADDPETTLIVKAQDTYSSIAGKDDDELEVINRRMGDIKEELDTFKDLINLRAYR